MVVKFLPRQVAEHVLHRPARAPRRAGPGRLIQAAEEMVQPGRFHLEYAERVQPGQCRCVHATPSGGIATEWPRQVNHFTQAAPCNGGNGRGVGITAIPWQSSA